MPAYVAIMLMKILTEENNLMPLQYKPRILILVADDDEDDCVLARKALMEWNPEADIRFAADGQVLMDYLHSCVAGIKGSEQPCPDLILLDLNMPRKSGREALREIKGDTRLKSIPVVILSTSSDQEDINFCHSHGANSFISKSSDFQGLIDQMKALGVYWFSAVSLPVLDFVPDVRIPAAERKVKASILAVDGSASTRRVLRRILEAAAHEVLEAADGHAAIELYRMKTPDVVLLDLNLNGLSGKEVLSRLKELDRHVKVIMVGADMQMPTLDELGEQGANGFLSKPFSPEAVLDAVQSALLGTHRLG
jgi:CheY-like chemotaxis protein